METNFTKDTIMAVLTRMRVLEILVDGCKKHPAYRAKREPKADCDMCRKMWRARKQLDETKVVLKGILE